MRREALVPALLLAAAYLYALWPPAGPWRLVWLASWAAFVLLVGAALRLVGRREEASGQAREQVPSAPLQVAHDVRTPLMRLRLLLGDLAESGPEGARTAAHLEAEVLHLERLAEDLMDLTADASSLSVKTTDVDLAAFIRELAPRVEPFFEARGCRLRVSVADVPPVRADLRQMERLVDNLVANALRHGEDGEVFLELRRDGPLWVRLTLRNPSEPPPEGVGEAGVRGRRSPRGGGGGFGLGLAVVRQLVRGVGGKLRLRYRDGCFEASVAFPRAPAV